MKTESDKNVIYIEETIIADCDFNIFYDVADILAHEFNLSFSNKISDLECAYWDFTYNDNELVLHYNIYLGISIYPQHLGAATAKENLSVTEISHLLREKLSCSKWSDFDNGNTIYTKGSEGGEILTDIEHCEGARITLEKKSNIAFAITFGIYGFMVHTHYEDCRENADKYIALTKDLISKTIRLYDVPEDIRDQQWYTKLESAVNKLAGMDEPSILDEKKIHSKIPIPRLPWWKRIFDRN